MWMGGEDVFTKKIFFLSVCSDKSAEEEMEENHKTLPVIVLDGQNVCMQHEDNTIDKLKGLRIALTYFLERGWTKKDLIVVFPREGWQRRIKKIQHQMHAIFVFPTRRLKEDDDIFALTIAQQHNALLLTNDRLRNHLRRWTKVLGREEGDTLRAWCCVHLLPFVFVRDVLCPHFEVLKKAMVTSKMRIIRCYKCKTLLAKEEDIISSKDPAGIYYDTDEEVNPEGYVFCFSKVRRVINTQEFWHDIITAPSEFGQQQEVVVRQESPPRMEDTWYPDYYSWCLLFCSKCELT